MIDDKPFAPDNYELLFNDDDDDSLPDAIPDDPFALNGQLAEACEADRSEDDDGYDPFESDKATTPEISEGDFIDPAQHFLFKHLKKHIRDACNVNAKRDARNRALEWLFVPSKADIDGIEFGPTCAVLGARPNVVRARTQHQLWKANILLSDALPFLAVGAPASLMSEIGIHIGPGLAEGIARESWFWPSIPAMELREKFAATSNKHYQAALESLTALGYLAIAAGRIYFISRNPMILSKAARNRFSFASAIHGD